MDPELISKTYTCQVCPDPATAATSEPSGEMRHKPCSTGCVESEDFSASLMFEPEILSQIVQRQVGFYTHA